MFVLFLILLISLVALGWLFVAEKITLPPASDPQAASNPTLAKDFTSADVAQLRFPVAFRGYRMSEVDEAIDALSQRIAEQQQRIEELTQPVQQQSQSTDE